METSHKSELSSLLAIPQDKSLKKAGAARGGRILIFNRCNRHSDFFIGQGRIPRHWSWMCLCDNFFWSWIKHGLLLTGNCGLIGQSKWAFVNLKWWLLFYYFLFDCWLIIFFYHNWEVVSFFLRKAPTLETLISMLNFFIGFKLAV